MQHLFETNVAIECFVLSAKEVIVHLHEFFGWSVCLLARLLKTKTKNDLGEWNVVGYSPGENPLNLGAGLDPGAFFPNIEIVFQYWFVQNKYSNPNLKNLAYLSQER